MDHQYQKYSKKQRSLIDDMVSESYDSNLDGKMLVKKAQLTSLVLSLYKLYRAVDSQAESSKINRIVQFIKETLSML